MRPSRRVSSAATIAVLVVGFATAIRSAPQERVQVQIVTSTGPQATSPLAMNQVQQNGRGLIVGQVVDAGTMRGVPGAIVTLGGALPGAPTQVQSRTVTIMNVDGPGILNNPGTQLPRVIADSDGRFAFRNLPAGLFNITTTKPGFLDGAYGRMRPNGAPQSIELADGERAGDISIRMFRPASISGTVSDDLGDPVVGVQVRAFRRTLVSGRRILTAGGGSAQTDDRGVYRLANLIPGEYIVVIQTVQTSLPASMPSEGSLMPDLVATLGMSSGSYSYSFSGSTTPDGKFTLQSTNGLVTTGPGGRLMAYPTQYYPAASVASQASPLVVGSGEDRNGIDLLLRLVPTFSISGRLIAPEGPAANYAVHLVPADTGDLSIDPDVATTISDTNGDFQFPAVPAGQYVIQTTRISRGATERVVIGQAAGGGGATYAYTTTGSLGSQWEPAGIPPTLWAAAPVNLVDRDVDGVQLMLRAGPRLSGKVEFDGAAERPPADRMSTISVTVESADGKQKFSPPSVRVNATGQFTVPGLLPGKYVLRASNVPGGWTFKGATIGGADITDTPFDVEDRDIAGVVITLFDRPSELRGTVQTGDGSTDRSAAVIVYPADTRSWMNYGVNPRRMRTTRAAGKTGTFTFNALPAGDYYLVAISDEFAGEWQDPQFLDQLTRVASRVTLSEGQQGRQDLTLQRVRPGGLLMPAADDDSGRTSHGPFVDEETDLPQQTQTQSRDTRPQSPARDTTVTPTTGTASMSGLVLADDRGQQPVRRAKVIARSADGFTERAGTTDDGGRFVVSSLPPGNYTLLVTKAPYLPAFYGSKRAGRGPGTPIALTAGQSLTNLAIRMSRGGVITGMVRDDYGLPVASASVRILQFRTTNGERTLTSQQSVMTDDRGVYRAFGLMPATYVICAMPPAALSTQNEIRQLSSADLQTAVLDLQRPVSTSAAAPAPSQPVGRTVGFAPVFYPGTPTQADAAPIALAAGQELTNIDISIRLVPTARVEGVVMGVDGRPAPGTSLTLLETEQAQGASVSPKLATTNQEGRFSFTNVAPGRYTITARGGSGNSAFRMNGGDFIMAAPNWAAAGPGAPPPPPPMPVPVGSTQHAMLDIDVSGQNVSDLSLVLQEGMTIAGRLAFAGKTLSPPVNLNRTRVMLVPVITNGASIPVPMAAVDATGSFKITGVAPGKYRLTASVPGGGTVSTGGGGAAASWALRSAVISGRDVLDTLLEIRQGQNIDGVTITFTDQPTEISGTLLDANNKPTPGFSIVVFSTDRATWTPGSRRISPAIQVASDGKYRVAGLPPGEYFLAALTDYEQGDLADRGFLEQIAAVAYRLTVGEGEKKVQDLKIAGGH